jgi:hypothetical protein
MVMIFLLFGLGGGISGARPRLSHWFRYVYIMPDLLLFGNIIVDIRRLFRGLGVTVQ